MFSKCHAQNLVINNQSSTLVQMIPFHEVDEFDLDEFDRDQFQML